MKKLLSEPVTYILAYIFMCVITFGHCYNHYPDEEKGSWGGINYTIANGAGTKTMGSFFSSIFWPLYWSVKLQEKQ